MWTTSPLRSPARTAGGANRLAAPLSLAVAAQLVLAAPGLAKTHLVFWADDQPITKQLVDEFNRRNPDIEVELQVQAILGPLSQMSDKVTVALAGGKGPDVMLFNRPYVPEWAAKGMLIPLDPYLPQVGVKKSQFIPFAWNEGTYQGKVYVLPVDTDARGVYVNKNLFAQAGFDWQNLPTNLAEFDLLARKLTRPKPEGGYAQVGFIPWANQGQYLFTWSPSFGGQFYDPERDRITVNDPRNVQILNWMKEYADRFGYTALQGSLPAGTLAMTVDTNGYRVTLSRTPGLDFAVGYLPAPPGGRQRATYAGGFGIAIPTGAKHPAEAARFIAFWVSDEAQLARALAKGNFPATLGAARSDVFVKDPIQRVFIEMLPNAQARPSVPILGQLWDEIKAATGRVLKGGEVPQNVLDDITARMQKLLEQTRSR